MTKKLSTIQEKLLEALGDNYQIKFSESSDHHGNFVHDICIQKDFESYAVNIHIKESCLLNSDISEIVSTIKQIYLNEGRKDAQELSPKIKETILSKNYVLKNVCYKMIKAENAGNLPHRRILDMAAVYQITLPNSKGEKFNIYLQNDLLKGLEISRKELDDASFRNMKKKGILFILPSSINELIIICDDDNTIPVKELQNIAAGMNEDNSAAKEKEILTDNIYRFCSKTGKLEIVAKG